MLILRVVYIRISVRINFTLACIHENHLTPTPVFFMIQLVSVLDTHKVLSDCIEYMGCRLETQTYTYDPYRGAFGCN